MYILFIYARSDGTCKRITKVKDYGIEGSALWYKKDNLLMVIPLDLILHVEIKHELQ